MTTTTFHPAIERAVRRYQEWHAGQRAIMVTARVPVQRDDLDTPPAYDGLDWEQDFDAYVRVNVENAKRLAETRLGLGLDDDYLPSYHPYFGISIHCAFFGGAVHFGGGTSYMEPVIERAAEWERLRADPENVWLRRLTRGLAYCRDHGDGVLLAGYRGGNGPMDMANGVMGNALFTELYDDPENMRRVLDVCTDGIRLTFGLQQAHNTPVMGGHIAAGVWLPDPMIGHLSVDASCLTGPATYDEFEKPCLERLAGDVGGYFMHVHMLGRAVYRSLCATQGLAILAPVDDPNQPSMLDALDEVLDSIGSTAFTIDVPIARFDEVLPKLRGRRVFIAFRAQDHAEAARALERIDHYLPLQRS
jgi:hypothetical protein